MAPNPHIKKSFAAMKAIGIDEKQTKAVLKKLLPLYDKNWELIAEDNYRVLADAIFSDQEDAVEDSKGKKKKAEDDEEVNRGKKIVHQSIEEDEEDAMDEPERPLKRLRRRGGEGTSTITSSTSTTHDEETNTISLPFHPLPTENNNTLIIPKDKHLTNKPFSQSPIPKQKDGKTVKLKLASSSSGEVEINLTTTGGSNLNSPSMDELKKAMEEKCLQSYKILDPNFSVLGFMNDICNTYLALATNAKNPPVDDNVMSLEVVPECQISNDEWKMLNSTNDITLGNESVSIPWINEINEKVPPSFRYLSKSRIYLDAAVEFKLANNDQCCDKCSGDCLMGCSCCVTYTKDGLLKEEFLEECIAETCDKRKHVVKYCKECPLEKAKKEESLKACQGHLKRKVVKECWNKCGCIQRCGNRVVQQGIHNKLQVFYTPNGRGWGLRTLEKLPKGAFVCEFAGEILTIRELFERNSERVTSPVILDAHWGSDEEVLPNNKALCLDGTQYGNISRFINHRCVDGNLIEIPVHVETNDLHYYHLAFFTTREIDAMEELTWDYGVEFNDDVYPTTPFHCICGSQFCRNIKRISKRKNVNKKKSLRA